MSISGNATVTITLEKTYSSTNYFVTSTNISFWSANDWSITPVCLKDSGNTFRIGNVADSTQKFAWNTCGYIS